jgi:four helix bundle protein
MADFRRLKIWQQSHAMAVETHAVASRMRGVAHSSLKNQMVRAAMSVPANIVEGREQTSETEFARFLGYSIASLSELEYHLMMARDIGAINETDFQSLLSQVTTIRPMAIALRRRLQPVARSKPAGSVER